MLTRRILRNSYYRWHMGGKDQTCMQTREPVVLMGELDLIRSRIFSIMQRDRSLEEEHHIVELLLDPICLHFWMTSHRVTISMNQKTALKNMLGNMRPWVHDSGDRWHWNNIVVSNSGVNPKTITGRTNSWSIGKVKWRFHTLMGLPRCLCKLGYIS